MKVQPGFDKKASSWLSSFPWCCAPLPFLRREPSCQLIEKLPQNVIYRQPSLQGRPNVEQVADVSVSSGTSRLSKKRSKSQRLGLSTKRRHRSDASSNRPLISAPSDFRHLSTGSFPITLQDQTSMHPRRLSEPHAGSSQPYQLSIYVPDHHLSPILPDFDFPALAPSPPPAYVSDDRDRGHPLLRHRSYSSLSFHVPRKQGAESVASSRRATTPQTPPNIEQRRARARAYTAPEMEDMKERVASAMIEVEKLQKQIDQVIERQSIYECSRPTSAHSVARTLPGKTPSIGYETDGSSHASTAELEPMPNIPALPPAAPSFAERLNVESERPFTAPQRTSPSGAHGNVAPPEDTWMATRQKKLNTRHEKAMTPPLPLVLRPPLRKKKSFSRVPAWLIPESLHKRDLSFDAVTNLPLPIKGGEGFYQISSNATSRRLSSASTESDSTWQTQDEEPRESVEWPPGSSAGSSSEQPPMERCSTFGKENDQLNIPRVGVAM